MKRIKWSLSIGLLGCRREGVIEVEDDVSEAEIEETVKDEAFEYVEWDYHVLPADDDE